MSDCKNKIGLIMPTRVCTFGEDRSITFWDNWGPLKRR